MSSTAREGTWPATATPAGAGRLPPGQRAVAGFPRFGSHLHQPAPAIPADPQVTITGTRVGFTPVAVRVADLSTWPRRTQTSDFHCVAGWSALDLRWEGVPFTDFWQRLIKPALPPGAAVTHLVLHGHDGYRLVVTLEDALADEVMLADRLDGRPLDSDHGAPVRFVSPQQYGYVSAKHLSGIELHPCEPQENFGGASALSRALMVRPLFSRHPRSRVWHHERNGTLPASVILPLYRVLTPPLRWLCQRGSRPEPNS